MSDGQNNPRTPPITKPPAGSAPAPASSAPAEPPRRLLRCEPHGADLDRRRRRRAVVRGILPRRDARPLHRRRGRGRPRPVPTVSESQPSAEDYEEALEEILPAGAAVRAGAGVPESGKGYEGEVYIDISTSDVYLFKDGEWVNVGNIRASAAANLTGETGAAGEAGAHRRCDRRDRCERRTGHARHAALARPRRTRERDLRGRRRRLHRHRGRRSSTSAPAERGRCSVRRPLAPSRPDGDPGGLGAAISSRRGSRRAWSRQSCGHPVGRPGRRTGSRGGCRAARAGGPKA